MTLEVLRVKIGLVAVRARELSIGILGRNGGALRSAVDTVGDWGRAARDTGQDTTTTLRAHDLRSGLILGGSIRRAIGTVHVGSHPPGLGIGVAEGTRGHAVEIPAITRGRRSNGLRVTLRGRRGRQATGGRRIGLSVVTLGLVIGMRKVGRRVAPNSGVWHDRS